MADFRLSHASSDAIKLARFVCIFFMCFVHIYGQEFIGPSGLGGASVIVIDVLGRASVPLLSAISGYLAVVSLKNATWPRIIWSKFKALVVPMAVWNTIAILFGLLVFWLTSSAIGFYETVQGKSLLEVIYLHIFAVEHDSVQSSHNFLRDIFACFVLFPILYAMIQYGRGFAVAAFVLLVLSFGLKPVVFREHIIVFFVIGMYLAHRRTQVTTLVSYWVVAAPLAAVVVSAEIFPGLREAITRVVIDYETVKRLVVSFTMLCVCYFVALKLSTAVLTYLSQITFTAFLSHNLVFAMIWIPFSLVVDAENPALYPVYFVLAPIILWGVVALSQLAIRRLPPAVQIPLTGKAA